MPKRPVIKIIMLSLATLGTVVICTAINRAESARMMAADSPGVPGSVLAAGFIVYPLLCALTGLVCGRDRWLRFVPAAVALAAAIAMLELAMVLPYAAVGYLFFFISRLFDKPSADGKQAGTIVKMSVVARDIFVRLSKPSGFFALLTAYALLAFLLLCPLEALDMLTEYQSPMFFTVPLGLIHYPIMFTVTGAAAGRYPKKLWPVPIVVMAAMFAISNCFDSCVLSLRGVSDMEYYIRNSVTTMLVYADLGYLAMLLSWLFFWKREELCVPRLLAVLGILAMGPLTYGAAYVPVCLWGHPLWGEALWYLMHLGLAAAVGIFSGTDVRRYFFMPIFPFLVTYMQIGPPILPGSQPKLPWALGEAWCCICLAAGILCMLVKACFKPAR